MSNWRPDLKDDSVISVVQSLPFLLVFCQLKAEEEAAQALALAEKVD